MFEQDGTYARLKEDIQHQSDKEIAAEVQDNFAKQVEAELNDPTKRTANIQAAKDAFLNSDLANQVRTELEESAHDEWTEEGKRLGIRQIEEDIAQGKDEFVADIAQKFPDTREGKRVTKEARNRAEAEWTEENMPVIAAELGEKEFANYCLGKIAEKKTAEATNAAINKLLSEFGNGGIDTTAIPEDSNVTIYLGEEGQIEKKVQDNYGYDTTKKVKGIKYVRRLKLLALGDGSFRVEEDTLCSSANKYASADGLKTGTVIIAGNVIRDKANGDEAKIVQDLKQGVELYYDDDTSKPTIIEGHYSVADVEINGTFARSEIETRKAELL